MAPTRPARMTSWVTTERSIIPLPIVFATWVPMTKEATKLKNAAHNTAFCGDSTRVDTTVAMELAASWNPFRKSKTSATRMMKTRRPKEIVKRRSSVLDDDVSQRVREVLALVASVFQPLVDLLPLQDLHRAAAVLALEEVADHAQV